MSRIELSESDDPVRVKVVVVGDMCVGKTAIALRFTKNAFEEKIAHTVGASYYIRSMDIEDRTILFQIWDTAGQERFRSLVPMYLRDADIALLVYDITSEESFHSLELWRTELLASAPSHVTTAVVGNKSDLGSKRKIEATDCGWPIQSSADRWKTALKCQRNTKTSSTFKFHQRMTFLRHKSHVVIKNVCTYYHYVFE
ncbi:ras-related protein Rab-5B-like isoform X2 [Ostrea edulis]|uniref:ras-related protein Rab-5B-like isoform X2 n=1 Tax=Ostrea edulis TaxID=37623 RepID=UPI0024AF69FE|nr:ras-related protein Rab-5B-like isoform X2 [Ostrea edulis]